MPHVINMNISAADASDLKPAASHLAAAFADDPLTRFLMNPDHDYIGRVTQFFSKLLAARIALNMPALVARGATGVHGAAMGYTTARPKWPSNLAEDWDRFEKSIPGFSDRLGVYEEISEKYKPDAPHYYLGVLGLDPTMHGRGIGKLMLKSFCGLSASDRLSSGVYLETAKLSNVEFYQRAGFAVTGEGKFDGVNLWCMYLKHGV